MYEKGKPNTNKMEIVMPFNYRHVIGEISGYYKLN